MDPDHYPNAVWDEDEQRLISDAEVAEVPFTAFTSRRRREHVDGRLIVRQVKRLNPATVPAGQGELFATDRHHAIFTDTTRGMLQAETTHRGHAIIDQVIADPKGGDIGVAEHTADLYHRGRFPLPVFTGANAPTTSGVFPRGEAVHYAQRAEELGVPGSAILLEARARNTGENFTLTRALLDREGIHPKSATFISRPYQQRRAYATCQKLWPELHVIFSSRPQSLTEYIESIGDETKVLNMLVGDTQRIWVYVEEGFAAPQPVTDETMAAFARLAEAGHTGRLIERSPK